MNLMDQRDKRDADINALRLILHETCRRLSDEDLITEIPAHQKQVDCHLLKILVDTDKAQQKREQFIELLQHLSLRGLLEFGDSHVVMRRMIEDRDDTILRLIAFGHALELWQIAEPKPALSTGSSDPYANDTWITVTDFQSAHFPEPPRGR